MELLNNYKESQVPYVKKMHMLINIDDMYIGRLERNLNNWGGLTHYDSFEEYLNVIVLPYLKEQQIVCLK